MLRTCSTAVYCFSINSWSAQFWSLQEFAGRRLTDVDGKGTQGTSQGEPPIPNKNITQIQGRVCGFMAPKSLADLSPTTCSLGHREAQTQATHLACYKRIDTKNDRSPAGRSRSFSTKGERETPKNERVTDLAYCLFAGQPLPPAGVPAMAPTKAATAAKKPAAAVPAPAPEAGDDYNFHRGGK